MRDLSARKGDIRIENYCPAEVLEQLAVDDGIVMFSRDNPERQKKALVKVARAEGGNVVAATCGGDLVAYIGVHRPSERERWGKPEYPWLFDGAPDQPNQRGLALITYVQWLGSWLESYPYYEAYDPTSLPQPAADESRAKDVDSAEAGQ